MKGYYLVGKPDVPEEKKTELAEKILQIMYKGGLRLADRDRYLVEKPKINDDGVIKVNYSIFENEVWDEIATYNKKTCELNAPDYSYNETRLVLNMVGLLIESYSDGSCIMMFDDAPMHVEGYIHIISELLGEKFDLPGRKRYWDTMCLLHKNGCQTISWNTLMNSYDFSYHEVERCQIRASLMYDENGYLKDAVDEGTKKSMDTMSVQKIIEGEIHNNLGCVGLLIQRLQSEKGANYTLKFLQRLFTLPFAERKKLTKEETTEGFLAAFSLEHLQPIFINSYAGANHMTFWNAYDIFKEDRTFYQDVSDDRKTDGGWGSCPKLRFYEAIQRNDEDDFLEYWDGDNILISDEMKNVIREWQEKYDSIVLSEEKKENVDKRLFALQNIYPSLYGSRYFDADMVREFEQHISDEHYIKAISLMRWYCRKDVELFPEMTSGTAIEHMLLPNRSKSEKQAISALVSLMANKNQRKQIFRF